jgi:hypothetical protein
MLKLGKTIGIATVVLLLVTLVPLALAQDNVVEVGLTEFTINMPTSVPAGPTIFRVTNNGAAEHNFEIEGQGIDQSFDTNLQPGESRDLQVDLVAGTYRIYCPVGNHEAQGMVIEEFTVTGEEAMQASPEATEAMEGAAQETPTTAEATATPAVATLPQTGGTVWPWTSMALLVVGGLILIGGLSLALMQRSR